MKEATVPRGIGDLPPQTGKPSLLGLCHHRLSQVVLVRKLKAFVLLFILIGD